MSAGMSGVEARRKADWFEQLDAALAAEGAASDRSRAYWIPGRIEFLGKHTDYAGGRSLLCAIERGICLLAAPRNDNRLRVHDLRSGEVCVAPVDAAAGATAGHWSNYPAVAARRIAQNFPGPLRGADVFLASDLPPAAGMSSSSALIVGVWLALNGVNELTARQEYRRSVESEDALAGYLGAVESGAAYGDLAGDAGVGTSGGSQDHTAILRSRPGALVEYSFAPVRFEQAIAVPDGYRFVVAASGVVAQKTGGARAKYNRAAAAVSAILTLWNRGTGRSDQSLAGAIASAPDAADRIRTLIRSPAGVGFEAGALVDRFEQFQTESSMVVPAAAEALSQDDLPALGALVDLSQQCAERLLGNQIPETIELARSARRLGAVAASAFGAGFGGSVWALVADGETEPFCAGWARAYRRAFPEAAVAAEFFATRAGPGATSVSA
jgi:galactokinase